MQACALTVIEIGEDAGTKIGQLASQLHDQGYTVTSLSVSVSDPAPPSNVTPITAGAAGEDGGAQASAAATEPADAQPAGSAPDNEQPFKCPACGATYATEVACSNGHAPVLTLPTAEVLAGATVDDAAAKAADSAPAAADAASTSPVEPPPATGSAPAEPAPETGGDAAAGADTPQPPAWPQ